MSLLAFLLMINTDIEIDNYCLPRYLILSNYNEISISNVIIIYAVAKVSNMNQDYDTIGLFYSR